MKTKIIKSISVALLSISLSTISCKKDIDPPASGLPVLTTTSFTSFDEISATGGGGSIASDGGFTVSQRGLCWATDHNPTINDNTIDAGAGLGDFSANLAGLLPGKSYYVRAFATNAKGTSYGNEVVATTTTIVVPEGLIGFYKFNANTLDYSGHNNQTSSVGISYVNDHKAIAGAAASFDGTTSSLSTDINGFNASAPAMSISMWVKSPDYHNAVLGESHNLFGITTSAPNYTIAFQSCSPTAGTACDAITAITSDNTQWNHFVVTWDGTTCKTYLNGSLSTSKPMGLILNASVTLGMGAPWRAFDLWTGYLDNVKIYNRAISTSEVSQLYGE